MLDKSIPRVELWMKREPGIPINAYDLSEDFSLTYFQEGDEKAWAKIETSVGEFEELKDTYAYLIENSPRIQKN